MRELPRLPGKLLIRLRRLDGDAEYEIGQMALVVRRALGSHVPPDTDSDIALSFLRRPGPRPAQGSRMINGRKEFGRVAVAVSAVGQVVHQHEYAVQELFAPTLSRIASALDDGQASWSFEIGHPDDGTPVVFRSPGRHPEDRPVPGPAIAVRHGDVGPASGQAGRGKRLDENEPAAEDPNDLTVDDLDGEGTPAGDSLLERTHERHMLLVLHMDMLADTIAETIDVLRAENLAVGRTGAPAERSVEVDLDRTRSVPFSIRKAAEPEPPLLDPGQYGMDTAHFGRVNVLLPGDVLELLETLELSGQVEEGGFLAGQVFRADPAGQHQFVRISRILPAKHSRASWIHFTFTSDSYQAMSQALATQTEERLVGWWHTHPHGIGVAMGLSATDVDLHQSTFQQPWQVAGLINLKGGRRMIRFYVADQNAMEECPLWTPDERDGYRHAGTRLGDF